MARDIKIILEAAKSAITLSSIIELWNEIANNKKQYPLSEIHEANRQIREYALNSKGEDIDKGKFYNFLAEQC